MRISSSFSVGSVGYPVFAGYSTNTVTIQRRYTFDEITEACCRSFDVSRQAVRSRRKDRRLAHCRFAIWMIARERTFLSYPQIGRLSRRDHSTVVHGIQQAKELLKTSVYGSSDFKLRYHDAMRMLEEGMIL